MADLNFVPREALLLVNATPASFSRVVGSLHRRNLEGVEAIVIEIEFADRARRRFHLVAPKHAQMLRSLRDDNPMDDRFKRALRIQILDDKLLEVGKTAREPAKPSIMIAESGDVLGVWIPQSDVLARSPYPPAPSRRKRRLSLPRRQSRRSRREPVDEVRLEQYIEPSGVSATPSYSDAAVMGSLGEPSGRDGAAPIIRRTPHLDAPELLPTKVGETFEVTVRTDTAPAQPTEESDEIVIEAPDDVKLITLDLLISTSESLELKGDYHRTVTIDRERDKSEPEMFTFEIVGGDALEHAMITAQFFYRGRPSGRVRCAWRDGKITPAGGGSPGLMVQVDATQPDITVVINDEEQDGIHFNCAVLAPNVPGFEMMVFKKWALPSQAKDFIDERMKAFGATGKDGPARQRALADAGRKFFESAPRAFKDALAGLPADASDPGRSKSRHSIYVATDEPFLPWEVMLPFEFVDGVRQDLEPLGTKYSIGRWVRSDQQSPPQSVRVTDQAVLVAPEYPGDAAIDSRGERSVLERRFGVRNAAAEDFENLDADLGAGKASILHFACHGSVSQWQTELLLENGNFNAGDVGGSDGFKNICGSSRPLVFLNACAVAGSASSLVGGDGFPRQLTDIGARVVIAPLWPVKKTVASQLAVEFYEEAVAQPERPMADILSELRARSYKKGDDPVASWAAYCFFGDPEACLEVINAR